jgi:hypothetical protein
VHSLGTTPAAAAYCALSDALDAARDEALAMWHDVWRAREAMAGDYERGWAEGYAQAEADMAASWKAITEPIARPERQLGRRLYAARTGGRDDAREHERAFVARAYATHPRDRSPAQRGAVYLYPPPRDGDFPGGRGKAA